MAETPIELDLNKFRTLVPINALYEDNLMQLVAQTRVERHVQGDKLFSAGDQDPYSLFLMCGSVILQLDESHHNSVTAGSDAALYALSSVNPRQFDAFIESEYAVIARVDPQLLEKLLAWGETAHLAHWGPCAEKGKSPSPTPADSEWMMAMLRSQTFLKLPASNIQELFSRMEEITVKTGDTIIHFGDEGDFYYMIKQGHCRVTRPSNKEETLLAELGRYDSFGEEALISDAPRNATVTMSTNGKLMRLAKRDFLELLKEPVLNWVTWEEAEALIQDHAACIDVRLEDEFEHAALEGAINIPLHQLRERCNELDPYRTYVLYCDTGQRSSVAAFLLGERGLDVYVLKGGLSSSA